MQNFHQLVESPTLPLLQAIDPDHIELYFAKDKSYHIHSNLTMVVNILDYCLHLLRHYELYSTNSMFLKAIILLGTKWAIHVFKGVLNKICISMNTLWPRCTSQWVLTKADAPIGALTLCIKTNNHVFIGLVIYWWPLIYN